MSQMKSYQNKCFEFCEISEDYALALILDNQSSYSSNAIPSPDHLTTSSMTPILFVNRLPSLLSMIITLSLIGASVLALPNELSFAAVIALLGPFAMSTIAMVKGK